MLMEHCPRLSTFEPGVKRPGEMAGTPHRVNTSDLGVHCEGSHLYPTRRPPESI